MVEAFAAGLLISIGCKVFVMAKGLFGALLFSIALLTIINYKLPLFTGRVGYKENPLYLLSILICNLIGAFVGGVMFDCSWTAIESLNRCQVPWYTLLFKGIGCGSLMYIAVDSKKAYITVMAVATFILCGFEHCIADAAFLNTRLWYYPWFLVPVIIGNTLGAKITRCLIGENDDRRGSGAGNSERDRCPPLRRGTFDELIEYVSGQPGVVPEVGSGDIRAYQITEEDGRGKECS